MAEKSKKHRFLSRATDTLTYVFAGALAVTSCLGASALTRYNEEQEEKESLAAYPAAHKDLEAKLKERHLVRIPEQGVALAFMYNSACSETNTGVVIDAERQGEFVRAAKYLACIQKPGDTVTLAKLPQPAC